MSEQTELLPNSTSVTSPDTKVETAPISEVKTEAPTAIMGGVKSEVKEEIKTETKTETSEQVEEEYDLELPEGSTLTEEDLNEIAEYASATNLSKADAEKLLASREGAYKKGISSAEAKYQEKIQAAAKEISSHADFIGDNKVKSFESISRVVNTFGDANLIAALNTPEIGNNLQIALFLKRLGDAMAPDSIEGKGSAGAQAQASDNKEATLQSLYPDFFKK